MADESLINMIQDLLRSQRRNVPETSSPGSSSSSFRNTFSRGSLFGMPRDFLDHDKYLENTRPKMFQRKSRANDWMRYSEHFDYEDDYHRRDSRDPRDSRGRSNDGNEPPERRLDRVSPSPKPEFRIREDRKYINISDIFERSSFHLRHKGIAIFIRGPPNSGKSYLAKLILQKERSLGNQQVSYLSAAGASGRVERRDRYKMMHRSDNFLQSFKDQLRKKCFNFYVIEIEFRPASMFNEIHRVVSNYTQFNTFLIECMQPEENMRKYQKQVRDFPEVSNYIEEMMNDRPSKNISLLDASEIYNRDFLSEKMSKIMINNIIKNDYSISAHNIVEPEVEKTENVFPDLKFLDNDGDHETQIEELLKDPNFIKLTQSSFTNLSIDPRTFQEKVKPDQDFLEAVIKTRAFRPKRKIEYNHKPLPDPYQHTLDFVPLKVFDYRHQTTEKLFELRDEIDIDEIVANKN